MQNNKVCTLYLWSRSTSCYVHACFMMTTPADFYIYHTILCVQCDINGFKRFLNPNKGRIKVLKSLRCIREYSYASYITFSKGTCSSVHPFLRDHECTFCVMTFQKERQYNYKIRPLCLGEKKRQTSRICNINY